MAKEISVIVSEIKEIVGANNMNIARNLPALVLDLAENLEIVINKLNVAIPVFDQIAKYGTISEVWEGGKGTFSGNLYDSINGYSGNNLTQLTDANKFYRRRVNGIEVLWADTNQKHASLGSNPFVGLTNCTVFLTFMPTNSHVLMGDGVNSMFLKSRSGGTGVINKNIGTPLYYLNGVSKTWVNNGEVYTDVVTGNWNVLTAKGVTFASWPDFFLNWYGNVSFLVMLGYVASIYIVEENLADPDRVAIETILLAEKTKLNPVIYTETSLTATPDIPDTAVTGLDYDPIKDEIILGYWGFGTSVNKLVFYDRATMTINSETPNLLPTIGSTQGMCYIPTLDAYLLNANGNNFYLIQRDGTILQTYVMPAGTNLTDSALDYYNGHIYYRDTVDGSKIRKCTITLSAITLIESIDFVPYSTSNDGGLHVNADGFTVWNGAAIRQFGWDGVFQLEIESTGAVIASTEGITMDNNGKVYACRDEYYHGGTPGGNKIWMYAKN